MSQDAANAAIVLTTTAAATAADSILGTMGVIFMGAFGGSLFALMNQDSTTLWAGARFMLARWSLSQFCSWPLMIMLDGLLAQHSWMVPRTAMLLFTAFIVACPREFAKELAPLLRLFPLPRSGSTKE